MKVLTIIDVQTSYMTHRTDTRRCIEPIRKLTRKFQVLKWPIIIVEMDGSGDTVPEVMLSERPRIRKSSFDGSKLILKECEERQWPLDFVLCGIFREICVRHTANGLAPHALVTVVMDATRPTKPNYKPNGDWTENVQLVKSRDFYRSMQESVPS